MTPQALSPAERDKALEVFNDREVAIEELKSAPRRALGRGSDRPSGVAHIESRQWGDLALDYHGEVHAFVRVPGEVSLTARSKISKVAWVAVVPLLFVATVLLTMRNGGTVDGGVGLATIVSLPVAGLIALLLDRGFLRRRFPERESHRLTQAQVSWVRVSQSHPQLGLESVVPTVLQTHILGDMDELETFVDDLLTREAASANEPEIVAGVRAAMIGLAHDGRADDALTELRDLAAASDELRAAESDLAGALEIAIPEPRSITQQITEQMTSRAQAARQAADEYRG